MVDPDDPRLQPGARIRWIDDNGKTVIGVIRAPGRDRNNYVVNDWWSVHYVDEEGKVFHRGLFTSRIDEIIDRKAPVRAKDFGSW